MTHHCRPAREIPWKFDFGNLKKIPVLTDEPSVTVLEGSVCEWGGAKNFLGVFCLLFKPITFSVNMHFNFYKFYKCNFEVFVDRKRNASKLDGGLNILKYFQSKSNFSSRSKYFTSKSGLNVDYVLLVAARWKKN